MTTPKRIFLSGKAATLHITEEMNLLKMKTAKTVLLLSARPECSKTTRGHLDGTEGPGKSLNVDTSSCTTTCIPEVDEVSRHLMPMSARNSRRLGGRVSITWSCRRSRQSTQTLLSYFSQTISYFLQMSTLQTGCSTTNLCTSSALRQGVSSDPCKPQPNTRT